MKHAMFSTFIAILSLLIALVIGHFLFSDSIPESWKVSGMMAGLYTGGTPNLVALGTALNVDPTVFVLTNTYDLIISSVFLLFFITIAQQLMNKILPHFNGRGKRRKAKEIIKESEGKDHFIDYARWDVTLPLLGALGLSILIFAVGGGLATLPFLSDIAVRYPQWFTLKQLADMVAVSESTPGPMGINMATYAGFKSH